MTALKPLADRRRTVELPCPACDGLVLIARKELLEGNAVQCPHCGADAELTQEYDLAHGTRHWTLEEPAANDDDNAPLG